jgi:glycosyltransferase involved in cell wall biosynthesis|tara:strand:+ start:1743 stop:2891 length:1149 start_codon:yes stop_codon:yes gene_type:complete
MVTGAYHPEINGAANQCRQLVALLKKKMDFKILTTTRNPNLSLRGQVDGVYVHRVLLRKKTLWSYLMALLKFTTFFLSNMKYFQIIHLHGYSLKSALFTILSKIFQKSIIIKMTSIQHDDPIIIRQRGIIIKTFYSQADLYVGTNPKFEKLYQQSQLPSSGYHQIPNGVDIGRFSPVSHPEKVKLRNQLGLPENMKVVLFVGHFSKEKCPDLLLNAWKDLVMKSFPESGLIFIGSTNPGNYEVDGELVKEFKKISKPHSNKRIFFVERTDEIEKYYQCSDIFVLPSVREGTPNALLEAMACALPVIVSKLEGITDWVVSDNINGVLFEPGIRSDLGRAIRQILSDCILAESLGRAAREAIVQRFSMKKVAQDYLKIYHELAS